MGSAIEKVSVFVIGMLIAETVVATLIKWEGDTIGTDDWRPLSTISRVIPLLVVSSPFLWWLWLPLDTIAASAIGAAAPQALILLECRVSTDARFPVRYALIPALPIIIPASVMTLDVVREEEEGKQQSDPP